MCKTKCGTMGENTTTGTDRSGRKGAGLHQKTIRVPHHLGAVLLGLACTLASVAFLVALPSVASASTQKPTKPVPAICSFLDDQAGSAQFLAQVGKDMKSHDVTALKELFLSLVNSVEKVSNSAAVRSAPASVQAAIKTVAHSMPTIKADIEKAATMSELEDVLSSMGKASGVQGAEHVLNNYANAVCGG